MSFRKVPDSALFVSEPNPMWFGNGANEKGNPTWTNQNWLKSRFHFSFAEYTNPSNSNFGVLRVMNDDLVQPARGFGEHPHREMEICTYVVEGDLTHQDSMGNGESLGRGSIQFMTAGTGVMHQEHNKNPKSPLRFIQMWIVPASRGLKPNYGSMRGDEMKAARQNAWAHMVSDVKDSAVTTPVKINQDVNMYATELEASKSLPLKINANRQAYVLCIEGSIDVSGDSVQERLAQHDAAEVVGAVDLQVTAGPKGAHLLYVEMKG
eukprot:CAMPEP_0177701308 /NCGR_PEP_ID=MMETSP0484_2-20121128/6545_1 /TAXON_ID=354590 /ORGANISM="Rhodomonas lens, Strain RHODO" /LENGTH=264 /DNA_ID=CAMNT_0019212539 /DNA_START=175 /DNA_END=966 /DNA_ORIENTATION=-